MSGYHLCKCPAIEEVAYLGGTVSTRWSEDLIVGNVRNHMIMVSLGLVLILVLHFWTFGPWDYQVGTVRTRWYLHAGL